MKKLRENIMLALAWEGKKSFSEGKGMEMLFQTKT
jgi:hypothetical protein